MKKAILQQIELCKKTTDLIELQYKMRVCNASTIHNLNNIKMNIYGYLKLAEMYIEKEDYDKAEEHILSAKEQTYKFAAWVGDLICPYEGKKKLDKLL